ncbi:MAG: nucleotidyltransferase domain-containing protein [Acidobacteria bacterium]|nr:MAG: nucleotidyltransferase domain-containing protein [Acidobacteriota bacterium]RLE19736.1 MAG: nucleotidyltransferase domain-containing protein [Acidobacteriota bacterium]
MNKKMDNGLSKQQLEIIREILAPFADRIDRVDLFGSRAQGTHRPNSDIDLVLRGDIDKKATDRLWTLFAESSLALKVDVLAYAQITKAALKKHIDLVSVPLFTKADLIHDKSGRNSDIRPDSGSLGLD